MWKRIRFLLLILPLISSFFSVSLQFSNIKKFLSLFSWTERLTKFKLGPHMDSRLMYHVYLNQAAGAYLFLYFFNFLSLEFQNIKFFVTLFCEAYKVETWYIWTVGWSIVYTKYKQPEYTCSFIFLLFFLSLQLAKIKNLHLQNCFNIPLMAIVSCAHCLLYFH